MSDEPASAEYTRFLASVEGVEPEYREELDMPALLALSGEERTRAEELLVARVKTEDDWRVPPAIAEIRLKRAIRPMKERLPTAKGRMRLALARALVDLDALESLDATIVAMLEEGDPEEGISALAAADDLQSPALAKALARASVFHPSPEVRINAGAGLLYMAKVTDDPLVWKYRSLYIHLGEEDEGLRRSVFEEICALTGLSPAIIDGP